jgi:hypothetical protein
MKIILKIVEMIKLVGTERAVSMHCPDQNRFKIKARLRGVTSKGSAMTQIS